MSLVTLTDNKVKELQWAESIVKKIEADRRYFVSYKDSRPIVDIKHMIETSRMLYGDHVAFMQKDDNSTPYRKITYKDMLVDVDALGTFLIDRGLEGKRIAVIGENCYQWAISYLATICGVGVVVPLDKELPPEELKNLIIESETACVICAKRHAEAFTEIKNSGDTKLEFLINFNIEESTEEMLSWSEAIKDGRALVERGDRRFRDVEIDNTKMAVLLFTSGTTGKSKGVMLSHKNLAADLMVSPTVLKVRDNDIFFSVLPLHHTYECTCGFLMPLYKGAAIAYCQGLKYVIKNLQEAKPTMFLGVPAIFEKMYNTIWKNIKKQEKDKMLKKLITVNNGVKHIGIDMSHVLFKKITETLGGRLRILICGGAAINPAVLKGFQDFGISALQGYGLTECAPMGALNPDIADKPESVGVSFPCFEVKTINDNEEGIGEICIKGDNVMMGYYNMPEETAKVIDEEGFFHTGDLGYLDHEGYLYITGRQKNVIITKNGKNVYPEEIEYQLSNVSFIEESFVFSQDNADEKDITIVASIKVDMEEIEKLAGEDYTDEDIKKLIWKEVDAINEKAPFFRKIKKVVLRKADFKKNTSNKLIRFAAENKEEKIY
ncbi:MAG: AMP-binding protein [Clostridiales bacterium]|nr:AMP-binding protein [Clostridiales bacterium]